jgi:DNA-binding Lrp family transcriptional regulator
MPQGGIFMSKNEAVALRVLEDFRLGLISRRQAAEFLDCSERAVSRRTRKLRQKGIEGIKHGNYQRPARSRLDSSQRDQMFKLAREQYYDFSTSPIAVRCSQLVTT